MDTFLTFIHACIALNKPCLNFLDKVFQYSMNISSLPALLINCYWARGTSRINESFLLQAATSYERDDSDMIYMESHDIESSHPKTFR